MILQRGELPACNGAHDDVIGLLEHEGKLHHRKEVKEVVDDISMCGDECSPGEAHVVAVQGCRRSRSQVARRWMRQS